MIAEVTPLQVLDNLVLHYKTRISKLEATLLGIKLALEQQGGYEHTIANINSVLIEDREAQ